MSTSTFVGGVFCAQPQFLQGSAGPLFANYYPAADPQTSVLLCPPFGDELNKSRRMLALQARDLQRNGCSVLQLDLYGCGDSFGEHREASWSQWQEDLLAGWYWLQQQSGRPPALLGLRLGGLMALELSSQVKASQILLWQPVLNGKQFIQQFLRLRLAAGAFSGSKETAADLRGQLARGEVLEVAGYGLSPELVTGIEAASALHTLSAPVKWYQLAGCADKVLSGPQLKLLNDWQDSGIVEQKTIASELFWQTPEIAENPVLVAETTAALVGEDD